MSYSHEHFTSQSTAETFVLSDDFARLLDGSVSHMLGGTLTYNGVGEVVDPVEQMTEAQVRNATCSYFMSYAEDRPEDTYLTAIYKDGYLICARASAVDGTDWVLCQSVYGVDKSGHKSYWRDPAYHKYAHDIFKAKGCTHWVSFFEEGSYFNDRVKAFGTEQQVWDFTDELFDYSTAEHEHEHHTYQIDVPATIPTDSPDETFGEEHREPARVRRYVKPQYRYRVKYKDWS